MFDILFLTPNDLDGFGGSGIQMAHLCRYLCSRGWSAGIVFRDGGSARRLPQRSGISMRFQFGDLPIRCLPNKIEESDFFELLQETSPKVVYIHAALFFRFASVLSKLNIRIVLYSGAEIGTVFETEGLAHAARQVVAIIGISDRQAANCVEALKTWISLEANWVVVIRQGTYCSIDENEEAYINEVVPQLPLLVSVGSTRAYKQYDHFIEVIARLRTQVAPYLGVVVGPIDRGWLIGLSGKYAPKILSNGVIQIANVLFVGPSMHVGNWLKRANCCLCTSTAYEGIPGALREAMLVGCPTASYNVGSVAELMLGGRCGMLARAGDISDLACRTGQLLGDKWLRDSIVSAARAHVLREFSADRHRQASEAFLRSICRSYEIKLSARSF